MIMTCETHRHAEKGTMPYDAENFIAEIKKSLNARAPRRILETPSHFRHAGVLIPLFAEEGTHRVLFTLRTNTVEHHKGQISFPGGAVDDTDETEMATALREAEEEIGLSKHHVEILGQIDDVHTVASDFVVHPFVGLISGPYEFIVNKREVQRLIMVPWETITSQHLENRSYTSEHQSKVFVTPAYEYHGDVIWGATANMLKNLLDILHQR